MQVDEVDVTPLIRAVEESRWNNSHQAHTADSVISLTHAVGEKMGDSRVGTRGFLLSPGESLRAWVTLQISFPAVTLGSATSSLPLEFILSS